MLTTNAPTLAQFKAALRINGITPTVEGGVTAIAQRGRFFRVKFKHTGPMDTGRPVSKHYYMPHVADLAGTTIRYPEGCALEIGDWAHLLFTEKLPAKLKVFEDGPITVTLTKFEDYKSIRPYEYVTYDCDTKTKYRLIVYGAYNAMGLIGSESNGLALLDNDRKEVVCDEMLRSSSGWGGPNRQQVFHFTMLARLMVEDADGFAVVINKHFGVSRLRTEVRA